MTSRRLAALALVLLVVAVACNRPDRADGASTAFGASGPTHVASGPTHAATGATGAPTGATAADANADLIDVACSIPHDWLLRTWRGNMESRSAELQILPIEPDFVGSGLPHVGPWPYAQDIPMFWYGPGHIK